MSGLIPNPSDYSKSVYDAFKLLDDIQYPEPSKNFEVLKTYLHTIQNNLLVLRLCCKTDEEFVKLVTCLTSIITGETFYFFDTKPAFSCRMYLDGNKIHVLIQNLQETNAIIGHGKDSGSNKESKDL